jgi:glycosyltransferase involved in cell wall biosynthesis
MTPAPDNPAVSVIVPARNEALHIQACLQSLADQTGAPAFEIIIVDNASTDATAALVQAFIHGHPDFTIRLLHQPTPGRGGARALGFSAAHGQLLLSTDADTTVPPNWVATLAAALSNTKSVAVTGTCQIIDCPPLANWLYKWLQPVIHTIYRLFMGHWWLTGSNFGIKRAAYEASGGFNPDCRDLEDMELAWRVAKIGHIAYLTPKLITVTTNGDRFKTSLLGGALAYVKCYIGRFWLRQGDIFARRD